MKTTRPGHPLFAASQLGYWARKCDFQDSGTWSGMLEPHKGNVNLEQLDQLVLDYIDKEQLAEVRPLCLLLHLFASCR